MLFFVFFFFGGALVLVSEDSRMEREGRDSQSKFATLNPVDPLGLCVCVGVGRGGCLNFLFKWVASVSFCRVRVCKRVVENTSNVYLCGGLTLNPKL